MPRYEVLLAKSADKVLRGYAEVLRERIRAKLNEIGANPRGTDSKKLKQSQTYRVRVGDYRILYNINDVKHVVVVTEIGNRREIYR